jgi:hypothetical protein
MEMRVMSIMDGSWFSVDSRTMAQDAAGPSTPTEKRSAFRHLYVASSDGICGSIRRITRTDLPYDLP